MTSLIRMTWLLTRRAVTAVSGSPPAADLRCCCCCHHRCSSPGNMFPVLEVKSRPHSGAQRFPPKRGIQIYKNKNYQKKTKTKKNMKAADIRRTRSSIESIKCNKPGRGNAALKLLLDFCWFVFVKRTSLEYFVSLLIFSTIVLLLP